MPVDSGRRNPGAARDLAQAEPLARALAKLLQPFRDQRSAQVAMMVGSACRPGCGFYVDTVTIPGHVSSVNIDGCGRNEPKRRA